MSDGDADCEAPISRSEPLIDAAELAGRLGVPKTWVLDQAREDRIPHVRLGRYVRFRPAAVEAWLAGLERRVDPDAKPVEYRKHKPTVGASS